MSCRRYDVFWPWCRPSDLLDSDRERRTQALRKLVERTVKRLAAFDGFLRKYFRPAQSSTGGSPI